MTQSCFSLVTYRMPCTDLYNIVSIFTSTVHALFTLVTWDTGISSILYWCRSISKTYCDVKSMTSSQLLAMLSFYICATTRSFTCNKGGFHVQQYKVRVLLEVNFYMVQVRNLPCSDWKSRFNWRARRHRWQYGWRGWELEKTGSVEQIDHMRCEGMNFESLSNGRWWQFLYDEVVFPKKNVWLKWGYFRKIRRKA